MIAPASPPQKFDSGQLVKHRRYGYRGVIVECDTHCTAPKEWYQSNKTQPERLQPWYHVLVHNSNQITYAAQTSLEADDSGQPVDHTLVNLFFAGFTGEGYVRNERPWPP
ncbi:MAG: heat shock protein HspQ [Planctomycetes bacterium]|nr:heat shock protein HspQ [Planctomycetota bacterium]